MMRELVLMKGKKDVMKHQLLKLGVAFALAGYLYSHFRTKRTRFNTPQNPGGKDGFGGRAGLKDVAQSATGIEEMSKTPQKAMDRATLRFSPASKNSTDEEGFLWPESNDLIKKGFEETGFSPTMRDVVSSTMRNVESVAPKRTDDETRVMDLEILNLQNMVQALQDREKNLEVQLLEYYGLKEQEALVTELQNRLKVNTMEAQFFSLKIESLQAENRKLKAQVSDYSKDTTELEFARAKIKQLKTKTRSDRENAREQLSALHQRVTALHDQEHSAAMNDNEVQNKLQRLKDMEDELTDLRRANLKLQCENSELAKKLESAMLTSALNNTEAGAVEEANRLRQANEDLEKKIERLQTDRCTDVEELVYLRWVNACLRYELRNYHPSPGKTVARDLSKALSPKSEERAKQLILEYVNSGYDESSPRLIDFDSEYCPSSQASTLTESEIDDTSIDVSSTTRYRTSNKSKFFSKLKRLVLGKDSHNNKNKVASAPSSCVTSRRMASIGSLDDLMGISSYDTVSSCTKVEHTASDLSEKATKPLCDSRVIPVDRTEFDTEGQQSKISRYRSRTRLSLDTNRPRNLSLEENKEMGCNEERIRDVGSPYGRKRTVLGDDSVMELIHANHGLDHKHENTPELKLKKYAQALTGSHSNPKQRRRSASFASF